MMRGGSVTRRNGKRADGGREELFVTGQVHACFTYLWGSIIDLAEELSEEGAKE